MFLAAGYETTAAGLAWFIHLVSKHPRVQSKIKAELKSTGNENDLSLDQLDSIIYLDAVINEVFNFTPPLPETFRTLNFDDRLPVSGVQLFKGDHVLIPIHDLARDTRYWSIDPQLFYPERFFGEDKNHHRHALIPFCGGHRLCMGQDFARFKLKVIAARLMQHVTFRDGGIGGAPYMRREAIASPKTKLGKQ
jgi:cytochrome P450